MQALICPKCNSPLSWDGRSELARCEYCGTTYQMHPRQRDGGGIRVGTGEVSPIETSQGYFAGKALVRCCVPKDWRVETNAPESQANLLAPLTMSVTLSSPGQDCLVTYNGAQAYNHIDPTPQNAALQGQLMHPSMILGLSYHDAAALCDGIVSRNPNLRDAQLVSRSDAPDAFAAQALRQALAEREGMLSPDANWARCEYVCTDANGKRWHKLVEALVSFGWIPLSPQERVMAEMLQRQQMQNASRLAMLQQRFGGAYYGMQMPAVQSPQPTLRWVVHFLLETSATDAAFAQAKTVHDRVRESYGQLPAFERCSRELGQDLRRQSMQEDQAIGGAMAQMAQDDMASFRRRQGIVSDLSAHASSVMGQMRESNDATMQRVRNLQSEAVREVNTFHARPGFSGDARTVEASTRWDHVYQNTEYPDRFAANEGAPLEFGVDFEELKQTDGTYT